MTTIEKIPNADRQSLAACLGAAQSEAERLFGDGPVRPWRPRFDRRPWVVGAALFAVAAALALLWPWLTRPLPERAPAAAAHDVGARALAPPAAQVMSGQAAPVAATAGEVLEPALGEAPAPASGEALIAAANPATTLLLPEDLEAWALDPQPIGGAGVVHPVAVSLVNTPVIPDEFDPTPADESTSDDESVEPPAE